jgi:hypothetical protein
MGNARRFNLAQDQCGVYSKVSNIAHFCMPRRPVPAAVRCFGECLYHRLFVSFQLINIPECPVPDTAEP